MTCTDTTPYTVSLNAGTNASGSTLPNTGTGRVQTIPVCVRIPSLANVVPGSYTDTVTVTITY